MNFLDWLIDAFVYVGDFFWELYYDCENYGWPLDLLSSWFSAIANRFYEVASYFTQLRDLLVEWADRISEILTWEYILNNIRIWFPGIDDLITWWANWVQHVIEEVQEWWRDVQLEVQSWIDDVRTWAEGQINSLINIITIIQDKVDEFESYLPSIQNMISWFTNWWGNILSRLIAWGALTATQIQSLIDSAFTARQSLWEGWQDVKDQVLEFFNDPLEWIWSRFTDWFLGPEV